VQNSKLIKILAVVFLTLGGLALAFSLWSSYSAYLCEKSPNCDFIPYYFSWKIVTLNMVLFISSIVAFRKHKLFLSIILNIGILLIILSLLRIF